MVVEGAGGKYRVVSLAIMALLGNIPIPFFCSCMVAEFPGC